VIVQFGGQTPLKLAQALEDAGIPILGTSPDAIDLAEDRERFAALVDKLKLKQPANGIARSREEAIAVANRIGYPVLMRPSYVLGGRAMEIVDRRRSWKIISDCGAGFGRFSPVLIDQYLRDAIEVDVDALCDGDRCRRGRRACSISRKPASIRATAPARCRPIACQPTSSPRSSGRPICWRAWPEGARADERAVRGQGRRGLPDRGQPAREPHRALRRQGDRPADRQDRRAGDGGREAQGASEDRFKRELPYIAVKEAVFPFARFPGVDPVLSPEMKSTGEVMGIDGDFATAFAKAQLGAGTDAAAAGACSSR
jgi:carbamoyl-phosphate synthase large subunit